MTTAIIITMLVVAVMLIAVLCAYVFHLKNEVNYWYTKYAKEEKNVEFWREKCEELADINAKSLDLHEDKYMDVIKKIDELVEENLKKDDQLEDLKSKYDALNESLNDKLMENTINRIKVTSLDDIFDEDTEELDFPNSHNEEDE